MLESKCKAYRYCLNKRKSMSLNLLKSFAFPEFRYFYALGITRTLIIIIIFFSISGSYYLTSIKFTFKKSQNCKNRPEVALH